MVCSPNITPVPRGPLSGTVRVPGSKSVSNRVLPLAVMGRGDCRIRGLLHSDDTQRCMEALCLLHPDGESAFEWQDGGAVLAIKGASGKWRVPRTELVHTHSLTHSHTERYKHTHATRPLEEVLCVSEYTQTHKHTHTHTSIYFQYTHDL